MSTHIRKCAGCGEKITVKNAQVGKAYYCADCKRKKSNTKAHDA